MDRGETKMMNKKGQVGLLLLFLVVIWVLGVVGLLYDSVYVKPIASNKANEVCKTLDFDQYKTFSRVGVFSKVPVGIKCEYAERYTDLGIRNN